MISYICVNIGCSSFLSIGILAARVGDSLQRLATTGILYLRCFLSPLTKGTNSWQWYTATHKTKSERLWILLIPPLPTLFAKFNLPQHRLAWRSNKREAKGRWRTGWKERFKKTSLWTKRHVVEMSVGKQVNDMSFGAAPCWIAVCTGNLSGIITRRDSDACISCEWTFLQFGLLWMWKFSVQMESVIL